MLGNIFSFYFIYTFLNCCKRDDEDDEDPVDTDETIVCLDNEVEVRIEEVDNQNKYVLNSDEYNENTKYGLKKGTYNFNNIPYNHSLAILDYDDAITVKNLNDPITIAVAFGNTKKYSDTNDYYKFGLDDDLISIKNTFYFMRNQEYTFITGDQFNTNHPLIIESSDDGITWNEIVTFSSVGESFKFEITEPKYRYNCQNHQGSMIGEFKILEKKEVKENDKNKLFNFYYGNIQLDVIKEFKPTSLFCYDHGYMGGQNILRYKDDCK